jgi:hypothetical protein
MLHELHDDCDDEGRISLDFHCVRAAGNSHRWRSTDIPGQASAWPDSPHRSPDSIERMCGRYARRSDKQRIALFRYPITTKQSPAETRTSTPSRTSRTGPDAIPAEQG